VPKKVKCLCGCGEEFSPAHNRKYASPACAKRVKAIKSAKRSCRYCDSIPPGKRKVCLAPECQAKMKDEDRERRRIAAKVFSDGEKMKRLRDNPVYCAHCGKPFGVKDNLRAPACYRAECVTWWEGEREIRRAIRNDAANKRRKMLNGKKLKKVTKPIAKRIVRPISKKDWFCQADYEKEQEAIRNNGRICKKDGCNRKTNGVDFYCEKHRLRMFARAAGGNFGGAWSGGEDSSRRAFGGVY